MEGMKHSFSRPPALPYAKTNRTKRELGYGHGNLHRPNPLALAAFPNSSGHFARSLECILESLSPAGGEGRVTGLQEVLLS